MSKKPKTLNQPITELTEEEMYTEAVYIVEVALVNPKLAWSEVSFYTCRLNDLIKAIPESDRKNRMLEKIKAKKRFLPYLNTSGLIDFTGYGEHFF